MKDQEIKEYFNNSHNTFGQDLRILMTTASF